MQRDYPNIYKTGRTVAGLTQEEAAELLHLSVESIKGYEAGSRTPPHGIAAAMADAYDTPWLRLAHLAATSEDLCVLPPIYPEPLAVAVVQLIGRIGRFPGALLLRIAEDGEIDESERHDFERLLPEVDGIAAAALQLKCCEGAKKERPGVGAPKRSVSARLMRRENHCKDSISQSRGNASGNSLNIHREEVYPR